MFKGKVWFFVLVLLILAPVSAVYAGPTIRFTDGWWDNMDFPGVGMISFDFHVPSIGLEGTGTQPIENPGRAVKGIFVGTMNGGEVGECEYNLAAFTLPNGKMNDTFHARINKCTGGLAGLHLIGRGWVGGPGFQGPWEGSYHYASK